MRMLAPLAAIAAVAAAPMAAAQPHEEHARHMMMMEGALLSVTAEQRIAEKPDMATINAGVVTEAPTAEAALAENARRMTAVIAALRRAGVAERDIQTSQLSVNPQTVYEENRPPRVTGYQAQNMVAVKLRNLANVGKTIDALVAQGGNQLNGVSFGLEDPDPALDRARGEAVRKARARAEIYAQAAGMRVNRIVSIEEGGGMRPGPVPVMARMAMEGGSTPVAAGEVDLVATVTMTFELK